MADYSPLGDAPSIARPPRVGLDPSMGGLARPEDATFLSGDRLSQQALSQFLPEVQTMFANRKLGRPSGTENITGPVNRSGQGGYYDPNTGAIALGRGIEENEGIPSAVHAAQHELLHALQYEVPQFRSDAEQGYPSLHAAIGQDWTALSANPRTAPLVRRIGDHLKANDWGHVFTELGLAHVSGLPLPPATAAYFSHISNPATTGPH